MNLYYVKVLVYAMHVSMVRVEGVEPSFQPWEGYIIAVIRYPQRCHLLTLGYYIASSILVILPEALVLISVGVGVPTQMLS